MKERGCCHVQTLRNLCTLKFDETINFLLNISGLVSRGSFNQ